MNERLPDMTRNKMLLDASVSPEKKIEKRDITSSDLS